MPRLQKVIIANIRARMAKSRPPITIGQLSIETDIDKSYLSKILRGQMRMHVEHLDVIARVLDVKPASLLK